MPALRKLRRVSILRSAWASGRHRRRILVGRGCVFSVPGTLAMSRGSVLAVGLMYGQAGCRVTVHGRLEVDGPVQVMRGCRVTVNSNGVLSLGARTYINDGTTVLVSERVTIGKGCAISWGVAILDGDGHQLVRDGQPVATTSPISIGDECWLGARCTVLKGTTLGAGTVVAAGSVVRGSTEPGVLVAGVPATVRSTDVTWER